MPDRPPLSCSYTADADIPTPRNPIPILLGALELSAKLAREEREAREAEAVPCGSFEPTANADYCRHCGQHQYMHRRCAYCNSPCEPIGDYCHGCRQIVCVNCVESGNHYKSGPGTHLHPLTGAPAACPACGNPVQIETVEADDIPRHRRAWCECGWTKRLERPDQDEYDGSEL